MDGHGKSFTKKILLPSLDPNNELTQNERKYLKKHKMWPWGRWKKAQHRCEETVRAGKQRIGLEISGERTVR